MSEPNRTAPASVVIGAIGSIRSAIITAVAIAFSGVGGSSRFLVAIGVGLVSLLIIAGLAYARWRRLTYAIGETDIRVESGIFSRNARSVPFERIQDVSLEAKPLPRLFGLVAVKFETGAGGGDDLALQYLTTAQGERLRELVRERRDEELAAAAEQTDALAMSPASAEDDAVLFAMGPRRLLTFGLFEFSLAVFAVLGGLLQYVDTVAELDVWNVDLWYGWLKQQGSTFVTLGPYVQAIGALIGLAGLAVVGMASGVIRTFLRDWGFTLTRSARGFRRQRGLLTRTDVVMPAHRVQGIVIGTGWLRYRFGWQGLSFVSLAQDDKNESHVVVPFARMDEITPVVMAAGFHLPDAATDWRRASQRYLVDRAVLSTAGLLALTVGAAIFAPFGVALIPLGLAVVVAGATMYAWKFHRHALDASQVFSITGLMSPTSRIATRLKLHSVEIAQGLLGQWRGYATVHLGLAGGNFSIPGVPLAEARMLRASVLETIAATDYSRLDQALSDAHSGVSANFLAT